MHGQSRIARASPLWMVAGVGSVSLDGGVWRWSGSSRWPGGEITISHPADGRVGQMRALREVISHLQAAVPAV